MKIGFIGTGVMGKSMAGHLLAAGHELAVHTRTAAKAEDLLERGALWADSPAEAGAGRDVVISMVGFPADVEETHLGPRGTLSTSAPPGLVIDMTTSTPSLARRLAEVAAARGSAAIDAPVSGGDKGAREAVLSIMVGGAPDAISRAMPLFEVMGRTIVPMGPAGAGQHTKMANQILVSSSMLGACEAIVYAEAAGLDPRRMVEAVSQGAAATWTIQNLAPRMLDGDFEPGFFVEHFVKDLGIALEEANHLGLDLPGLTQAARLYRLLEARGLGRKGTQALLLLYRDGGVADPG
jgi:3-hydroxyisobutyrate dehydrogenase